MLIDQGFCVDSSFADLSAAAEGVFCRLWSFCRLSRLPSVRRENLPRWHHADTQEAFAELVAAGRVVILDDGTVQPLALQNPHAPVQVASPALPVVVQDEEARSSSPALPEASSRKGRLSRSEAGRIAAEARWAGKRIDANASNASRDASESHDATHANASMRRIESHDANAYNAGASEKKEERKEEDKREGESAHAHANASGSHPQTHANASPPADTPGERTHLREAHRSAVPAWALQQIENDAITTGKRPDDVLATWAKFVDHWISDGKLSASWAAEWRKWLGNERVFAGRRAAERAAKEPAQPKRVDLLAEAQKRQAAAANAVQPTMEELDAMIAAVGQNKGAA